MENVGSIAYDARITSSDFSKDADKVERRASQMASTIEKSGNRGFGNFAAAASVSFNSVADGLSRVLKSALLIGAAGSVGIGAAAKASWDQASAVQQATIALNAYEKNTGKVNKTLSELVAYARSDLGVLFNRKDLFAAAQQLKIMGDNTDDLTSHVKIMSRSVGLGLSTWEGLGNVINRVGSTGMLYADDLKYLQNAGFKLDSSLSGTTQTFETLFAALDKGIPADAMAGQANTIVGLGVRLQTAFRNIGDAILGVNADTGKFVAGGLGDRLVGLMGRLTFLLKDPDLKEGFAKMGRSIGDFATTALPVLVAGFGFMARNMDALIPLLGALTAMFVVAKVAAIGLAIATAPFSITAFLIAAAITALIGVLVFLELRFHLLSKTVNFLKPAIDIVRQAFSGLISPIVLVINTLIYLARAFPEVARGARSMAGALLQGISHASSVIGRFFAGIGHWLYDSGRALIQGLINGIKNSIGDIKNAVGDAANTAKSTFKSALGIHSPSTVFAMYGKNIVQGLAGGIDSNAGMANRSIADMVGGLGASNSALDSIDTASIGSSRSNISVSLNMSGIMARSKSDERDIAKSLLARINEELGAKGQPILGGGAI